MVGTKPTGHKEAGPASCHRSSTSSTGLSDCHLQVPMLSGLTASEIYSYLEPLFCSIKPEVLWLLAWHWECLTHTADDYPHKHAGGRRGSWKGPTKDIQVSCYHTSRTYYLESFFPDRLSRACKTSLIISLVTRLFEWFIKPALSTAYFRTQNHIAIATRYTADWSGFLLFLKIINSQIKHVSQN